MLCENFNCSKEAIFSCLFSPQLKTLLYWLMSHLFLNNLKGIPSMIYNIPPPEEDRSKRIGFSKPGVRNWDTGKDSSCLVSDIISKSRLTAIEDTRIANSFLIELMFRWPIKMQLKFLRHKSFKISKSEVSLQI